MINKQSLWFITLFSLILILGIYYVTMPEDAATVFSLTSSNNEEEVEVTELDVLASVKAVEEEKMLENIQNAKSILLNSETSVEEKNNAYEALMVLNNNKSTCLKLENKIKEKFNVESAVTINQNKIIVTLSKDDEGAEYANKIISYINSLYEENVYVTVKFKTN